MHLIPFFLLKIHFPHDCELYTFPNTVTNRWISSSFAKTLGSAAVIDTVCMSFICHESKSNKFLHKCITFIKFQVGNLQGLLRKHHVLTLIPILFLAYHVPTHTEFQQPLLFIYLSSYLPACLPTCSVSLLAASVCTPSLPAPQGQHFLGENHASTSCLTEPDSIKSRKLSGGCFWA